MKIRLVTVIWGEAFVDVFLRLAARTLLAEGNIPTLAHAAEVTYTIYTTEEDAARLRGSPVIRQLEAIVPVRYSFFTLEEIDSSHFGSHNDLWHRAVELARRNKEVLFFIMPDILYGAGTLARWLARLEEGKKAVYTPGPQVVLETVLDEIEMCFPQHDAAVSLGEDGIRDMLFRHFHPLAATMLRDCPRRILHPEHDIRPVRGKGMVIRALTSQPLCLVPSHFLTIRSFNPADHLDDIAFEPCTIISAEPLVKHLGWYYRPWTLDGMHMSNLGGWWNYFGTAGNIAESMHPYRIALNGAGFEHDDGSAVNQGRVFRAQILATRAIQRAYDKLVDLGSKRTAEVVAAAHYGARLRRRLALRPGATLLVPVDNAFKGEVWARVVELLKSGREPELVALIKNHIVPAGSSTTLHGIPVEPAISGARIVGGPAFVNGLTIYQIDRILWTEGTERDQPAAAPHEPSPLSQPEKCEGRLPGEPRGIERLVLGRQKLTPWALRSRLHRCVFLLVHVPVVELVVAVLVPVYFRSHLRELARQIYVRLSGMHPRMGGALRLLRQFVEAWRTRGAEEAVTAASRRLRRLGGVGSLASRAIYFVLGAALYLRRHGVRRTARRLWRVIRSRRAVSAGKPLPEVERKRLATVRVLNGLVALDQVLAHYECAVLGEERRSAPRALVAELVGGPMSANQQARKILGSMAGRYGDVADICLEQGWTFLDEGDHDRAREWFIRASGARRTAEGRGVADLQGYACEELARLSRDAGNAGEALQWYRAALERSPGRSILRVAYADLLRKSGNLESAIEQYAAAMGYEGHTWPFPRVPRDIRELSFEGILPPGHGSPQHRTGCVDVSVMKLEGTGVRY